MPKPRRIATSRPGSFAPAADLPARGPLTVEVKTSLTHEEIDEYRQFTIETYFQAHPQSLAEELRSFKAHDLGFFQKTFRLEQHRLNNRLVAVLLMLSIDNYPHLQKDVWHVGYWGMRREVRGQARQAIRADWANHLRDLSAQRTVSAVMEDWNLPAQKMAADFGMQISDLTEIAPLA